MSRQTKEYAKKLVAQMTVEEKMSQMLYESPAIERLNIPAYNWWNEAIYYNQLTLQRNKNYKE